jgi:hypothetical protein
MHTVHFTFVIFPYKFPDVSCPISPYSSLPFLKIPPSGNWLTFPLNREGWGEGVFSNVTVTVETYSWTESSPILNSNWRNRQQYKIIVSTKWRHLQNIPQPPGQGRLLVPSTAGGQNLVDRHLVALLKGRLQVDQAKLRQAYRYCISDIQIWTLDYSISSTVNRQASNGFNSKKYIIIWRFNSYKILCPIFLSCNFRVEFQSFKHSQK